MAVAERLGRRWIGCDLGRFAIHTSRKRLLEMTTRILINLHIRFHIRVVKIDAPIKTGLFLKRSSAVR